MSEVWEPVEQAGLVDGRGDVLKIRTTGDGKQSVYAESDDGWVLMPDAPVKYRICRANPAQQWSQELPTEARWWWWYHDNAYVELVWAQHCPWSESVEINGTDYYYTNTLKSRGFDIPATDMSSWWWMPATVPHPPKGESE